MVLHSPACGCHRHKVPARLPACSAFATSEGRYPYYSGATDHDGACNITRLSSIPDSAKVSLAAPGYMFLQQWSAAALREVGAPGTPS